MNKFENHNRCITLSNLHKLANDVRKCAYSIGNFRVSSYISLENPSGFENHITDGFDFSCAAKNLRFDISQTLVVVSVIGLKTHGCQQLFVFKFDGTANLDAFNESELFDIRYISHVEYALTELKNILLEMRQKYYKQDTIQHNNLLHEIDTLLGEKT